MFDFVKGLYSSDVHINTAGKHNGFAASFFRNYAKIPDNNMFVTSFVLYTLLEAESLG